MIEAGPEYLRHTVTSRLQRVQLPGLRCFPMPDCREKGAHAVFLTSVKRPPLLSPPGLALRLAGKMRCCRLDLLGFADSVRSSSNIAALRNRLAPPTRTSDSVGRIVSNYAKRRNWASYALRLCPPETYQSIPRRTCMYHHQAGSRAPNCGARVQNLD